MKYIKQISTGKSVYRESPHSDKTLGNASNDTGIALNDLQVIDEAITDEQWTTRFMDELPWTEKMRRSDTELLPRTMEDILDTMSNKTSVAQITLDKLQAKKDLRATNPGE